MSKRGQVAVFIIVGIIIVSLVALFLILSSQGVIPGIGFERETESKSFLDTCLEDSVRDAINLISSQGGYISNQLNISFEFDGEDEEDISYLCYNQNDYLKCVNQNPLLFQHLENEIKEYIEEDVGDCYDSLISNSKARSDYYNGFEVVLLPRRVEIKIDAKMTTTKGGESTTEEGFDVVLGTRLYEIVNVVQEIVNREATECEFKQNGYMLLYPQFSIDKIRTGDSSIIYTVLNKDSDEMFRFAVRGCVIPPGF